MPADLSRLENSDRGEVFDVFVVGDKCGVGGGFKVMSPYFERLDNGEELFVVDFVVAFRGSEFARVEGDGVENIGVVGLGEDTSDGEIGGVSFNDNGTVGVKVMDDGGKGESGFESVESLLLGSGPGEYGVFFEKFGDGGGNLE